MANDIARAEGADGRADSLYQWPVLGRSRASAGVDSRRTNLAFSSYAENRAAAEAPQPMRARAGAAERKRTVRREAAFRLSVFTAAAIALLLSGAILKLACRTNTQDHRRTAETWLQDSTS
jgi:hypothetical protein